jgi:hypothetical protein
MVCFKPCLSLSVDSASHSVQTRLDFTLNDYRISFLQRCEPHTVYFSAVFFIKKSLVCPKKNVQGILNKRKKALNGHTTAIASNADVAGSSSPLRLLLVTMTTTAKVNVIPSGSEKALLQITISDAGLTQS